MKKLKTEKDYFCSDDWVKEDLYWGNAVEMQMMDEMNERLHFPSRIYGVVTYTHIKTGQHVTFVTRYFDHGNVPHWKDPWERIA